MTSDLNIPDTAIGIGWHEFRYPRPALDDPSAAFLRGLRAAAPLIIAAELERLIKEEAVNVNEGGYKWRGIDVEDLRRRVAELRGEASHD